MIVAVNMNAIAQIEEDEIEALAIAAWNQGRECDPLVRLLRKLAPNNVTLAIMDARAKDYGFVQAGSNERIDPDRLIGGPLSKEVLPDLDPDEPCAFAYTPNWDEPSDEDREACAGGGLPADVARRRHVHE